MDTRRAFANSLRQVRKARGLTQEDFSDISSRTYLSTLERGLKSPTLDKVQALAETLSIHPLTLLAITYMQLQKGKQLSSLLELVSREIHDLNIKASQE
ncbi:helix-turn-helix domain-containing protein [Sulfurirhabdus autotrophica]|uniref:Xre family transcriptional regulator n=1 Tax=Sulfurirhabdus autotrophica TaxID=1706046 RepID=A0A4R3XSS2_9PROT|nr:helix-turn-helix transcriptional regulator [Sulfurirhabdus autotrophica]TCV79011.1 Xre family transcriptional regulator [Sulfurirhabdus autotrophica]